MHCRVLALLTLAWLALAAACAQAGELTREKLAELFPAPMEVGEKDAAFPVWPLFNGGAGDSKLAGWIFETTDIAPIPGFSGTPPNLLVVLGTDGTFLDVRVISHHEPIFLDGLGEEPLHKYVEQYRGLALGRPIKVGSNINSAEKTTSGAVYVNGVLKATASVLIINQTILASAIKVAKAKLGIAGASANTRPAQPNPQLFEKLSWAELLSKGLVKHITIDAGTVDALFKGTAGEGQDAEASANPAATLIDLYVTDPLVPSVGRNLLGDDTYKWLKSYLADGQPALMVLSAGRWSAQGEDWTPGSVPDRLVFKQAGLPIVVRDMAFSRKLALADAPEAEAMILKIPATAGFDPASAFDLIPHVTRSKGIIYPEQAAVELPRQVQFPANYYIIDKGDNSGNSDNAEGWQSIWQKRWLDVTLITLASLIAIAGLIWQTRSVRRPTAFKVARLVFMAFTLGFIGWHAQAQLSVVTLIGLVKAAALTHDFSFLLWDPPSLLLWAVTIASFVIWGRALFCGWLCPFGALQEFAGELARVLKIPQWRVPDAWDRHLRNLKYVSLAMILLLAVRSQATAESFAEVEPFKTSITLIFQRHWPFVLYAAALLAANLFVYKAFCRYLCPLGAFMALGDALRIGPWLPRRRECGSPCQLCRVRCRYGAIAQSGAVNYRECFGCLDCTAIFVSPAQCVPQRLKAQGRAGLRERQAP